MTWGLRILAPFLCGSAFWLGSCGETDRKFQPAPGAGGGGSGGDGSEAGKGGAASGGAGTSESAGTGGTAAGSGGEGGGAGGDDGGASGAGGEEGEPLSFCDGLDPPAGIASSDFACLDFDLNWPDADWTLVQDGATVGTVTERFHSAPNSLHISAGDGDEGTLTWTAVGADQVQSVTVSAEINRMTWPGWPPPWDDGANLICIEVGNATNCLKLQHETSSDRLYIETIPCTVQTPSECQLTGDLNGGAWSHVEMTLTGSREIELTIDGASVVTNCDAEYCSDTGTSVTVGLDGPGDSGFGVTYDDITVAVGR